ATFVVRGPSRWSAARADPGAKTEATRSATTTRVAAPVNSRAAFRRRMLNPPLMTILGGNGRSPDLSRDDKPCDLEKPGKNEENSWGSPPTANPEVDSGQRQTDELSSSIRVNWHNSARAAGFRRRRPSSCRRTAGAWGSRANRRWRGAVPTRPT